MTEEPTEFTIENFYELAKQGKLMAAQCSSCGKLLAPPRPMCPKCFSRDLQWKELNKQGKLLTYTIIHVSPERFKTLTPYAVGIVELQSDAQLPGMIKNIDLDRLEIGMNLQVAFEKEPASEDWPQWPRYCFVPATNPAKP